MFDPPSFRPEQLTVRILADVDDVDPSVDDGKPVPFVSLVSRLFIPGVDAQLCLHADGMLQWLTEDNVAGWNVSHAELFALAIGNLNTSVPESKLDRLKSDSGEVYSVMCDEVMPSSFILADSLLSDFGFAKENIAAVLPNRETYIFCDKASPGSVELLKTVADIARNDEDSPKKYRISRSVLVADQQAPFGWVPSQHVN